MPIHLPVPGRARSIRRAAVVALVSTAIVLTGLGRADAANRATPGNFTGYGFDQCVAPTQSAMDAWLESSPFWAVGIYISGDSRACRSQPNLTPTWVSTQLRNGWRLLPITLGPQASCNSRYPRYGDDVRIRSSSTGTYAAARRQGRLEADDAVDAAKALGISPGSTLWYDMEAYDISDTACRESALWFTSAWTDELHALGYVSGAYSSAASGIKALDDARVKRPTTFTLPDRIWIARWDHNADTTTSYIRSDGWLPGGRMKQYEGGHPETYGGVTINIDRNWIDLGTGSAARPEPSHCGNVRLDFPTYPMLRPGDAGLKVTALQCLLFQQGYYGGELNGVMDSATAAAVRAMRTERGLGATSLAGPRAWTSLHAHTGPRLMKYGAAGERVRRLQRALNSASKVRLPVTGTFEGLTESAVKSYQGRVGLPQSGVVTAEVWASLQGGNV